MNSASLSLNPNPNPNSHQWQYTWETLSHVPSLRLYLFNPIINPSTQCLHIKASRLPRQHALDVEWVDAETLVEASVRVPVPRVLIDPDGSVDLTVRDDHVEVKLVMVLPVDHPLAVQLSGLFGSGEVQDRFEPFSIVSELKNLSCGDVHFFCKNCSARLTRQPFRCFVELPSVNWRESADNWFGNCCCSFGGISEKMVSKYISSYTCTEGTCLLDSASVIVCKDDLECSPFPSCLDKKLSYDCNTDVEPSDNLNHAIKDSSSTVVPDTSQLSLTSNCVPQSVITKSCKCEEDTKSLNCPLVSSAESICNLTTGNDQFFIENCKMAQLSLDETNSTADLDLSKSNHGSANHEKLAVDAAGGILGENCHCCTAESVYLVPAEDQQSSVAIEETSKGLDDCYLGSGFISRTSNLSDDVEWINFSCRQCSSIIGSYPTSKIADNPLDNGVRLFKCYISTDVLADGPHDIFRKYTLERIFVNLLLEGAKDELSFRLVLRDLKTKIPMLQIVLLNSESWCSAGYCMENEPTATLPEISMQPVVKVLFSDCTSSIESSSRTKDWLSRTHTEEAYMMAFQIQELTNHLRSAVDRLPTSCNSLQGMSLSYMKR